MFVTVELPMFTHRRLSPNPRATQSVMARPDITDGAAEAKIIFGTGPENDLLQLNSSFNSALHTSSEEYI